MWLSDPSVWPEDITATATAETLAEAKTVREIFKFADDKDVKLLHKHNLWHVLRVSAWIARFVHNSRNLSPERKKSPLTSEEEEFKASTLCIFQKKQSTPRSLFKKPSKVHCTAGQA